MATISVSDVPQGGRELEHYAAALFQAAGYYVESNVEETDEGEAVLELDLVATDYHDGQNETVLGEAKSGGWGYAEVFKLGGWMRYLGIERGVVVCPASSLKRDAETIASRAASLSIQILNLGDFSEAQVAFNGLGLRQIEDEVSIEFWRYSYWIETVLFDALRQRSKSNKELEGLRAALHFRRVINDEIFFQSDVTQRLHNLYDEFKSHPKLSLGLAREADGQEFVADASGDSPRLTRALREGTDVFLQASMYLEHRARLAVMKAAVDLSIETGGDPWTLSTEGTWGRLLRFTLPETFRSGMTELLSEPYFHLYPKFWQSYLWSWGGFYLTDRADREFGWMSAETGIPAAHIPDAIAAFDKLFPIAGGWEWGVSNASWRQVKMMPWQFRGLGAARRQYLYGANSYTDLGYPDWTAQDLAKWHNSFVLSLAGTEEKLR